MKSFLIILFCLIFFNFQLTAQNLETKYCNSIDLPETESKYKRKFDTQEFLNGFILKIVAEIIKPLDLKMNFIIRIDNNVQVAKATYDRDSMTRYLDINEEFFKKFKQADIEIRMILGHELGHHLNFDFQYDKILIRCKSRNNESDCKKWQEKELAADFFSGSSMHKLGAERSTCEDLVGMLLKENGNKKGPQTHPNTKIRIGSFLEGYDSSESYFKELLSKERATAEHYRNQALIAAYDNLDTKTEEEWEVVINLYNKAILENPELPLLYAERGYFYNQSSNSEAAITDISKAMQLDADNSNYFLLANEIKGESYQLQNTSIELEKASSISIENLEKEVKFNLKGKI